MHVHRWSDALTGDLHQSEFAERQDVMASTIALHDLCHVFVELLIVLSAVHIDEINDDDAAHIPEP